MPLPTSPSAAPASQLASSFCSHLNGVNASLSFCLRRGNLLGARALCLVRYSGSRKIDSFHQLRVVWRVRRKDASSMLPVSCKSRANLRLTGCFSGHMRSQSSPPGLPFTRVIRLSVDGVFASYLGRLLCHRATFSSSRFLVHRNLRAKLYKESYEFVRQQRIQCLFHGAWFVNGIPLSSSQQTTGRAPRKPSRPWRYMRLVSLGSSVETHNLTSWQDHTMRYILADGQVPHLRADVGCGKGCVWT
jgi:hypothetical protein